MTRALIGTRRAAGASNVLGLIAGFTATPRTSPSTLAALVGSGELASERGDPESAPRGTTHPGRRRMT